MLESPPHTLIYSGVERPFSYPVFSTKKRTDIQCVLLWCLLPVVTVSLLEV